MRERVTKLLGNGVEKRLILGTFHSVCRRYLVSYGHLIGIQKGFGIADSSDTVSIIKRIIKRLGVSIDPRKAQSRISSRKSRGGNHNEGGQESKKENNVEQQEFAIVFEAYEDQLGRSNLLDYDDLLLRCADLLRRHPTCVSNVEAVFIDEFQDTNIIQFELMCSFAAHNQRITTVGDPDQSIYGWRSAEIKNLKRMKQRYPDTLMIHLRDNYRSSGAILLAAFEVIEQDESRPSKQLLPTHCPGTVPVLRRLPSAEDEASWIVVELKRVMALTGNTLNLSDFAILLRSASLSRHIESAMGKAGLSYRMVGGQRFFDRVEIKILLDYLRVISQPHNNDALSRILNVPARAIGPSTAKELLENAELRGKSLWTHIRDAVQGSQSVKSKISKAAGNGLGSLINIILFSQRRMSNIADPCSPEDLLKIIIKKLDFKAYLEKMHSDDHEMRWANVEELVAQATECHVPTAESNTEDDASLPQLEGLEQVTGNAAEEALSRFLANVALATELQREDEDVEDKPQSQVTISTIHAAKGLEWPVIFVPSAYEGSIPHSRAEDTDEERRLLYVAMTRAQALLYLSCPMKNSQRGETTLSPFLSTKKVRRYLVNQGPAIDAGAVNDICRILSRDLPKQAQIVEACKSLQSQNDDFWSLNGEEDPEKIGSRPSKWDSFNRDEHVSKRRRLKGDEVTTITSSGAIYSTSTFGTTTTMQNSSAFSCSGFVSATAHLHQIDQQHEVETDKKASLTANPKANRKAAFERNVQGNLMSFWRKPCTLVDRHSKANMVHPPTDAFTIYPMVNQSHRSLVTKSTTAPQLHAPSMDPSPRPQRAPLAAIPQPLSNHRLPALSNFSRPYPSDPKETRSSKQYVFLSSSPPHGDSHLEDVEQASSNLLEKGSTSKSKDCETTSQASDIKPVTTLHTTSVSQIQTTKKTLGVRRSMNGWAGRAGEGFSVPRMGERGGMG